MIANKKKKFKPPKDKSQVNKRGRLIVRNLPFSATEDAFRDHFSSYGTINDLNLLKKPDGKLIGCGFVQFDRKQSAAKAIHHLSGKHFMGRPIIVDWALPKNKFGTVNKPNKKDQPGTVEVKDESLEDVKDDEVLSDISVKEETSESESESELESTEEEKSNEKVEPRPRPAASHDIGEGKTVFLKNVPFNCTNDELKAFMENIGPVYYAVVCIDPLTEHSKGTAFVKFKNQDHASKCIHGSTELDFKNHNMQAMPALDKKNLMNQDRLKHPDKKKDTRNLYLIKEGVVIAGTRAADGVSMSDMKKRLDLESWKNNILKNLNMFLSRTRLIVHNLPPSYDDKMLRSLFKKHAPTWSRITEAKVMRNMRQLDKKNKPVSKGYGFVSFSEHEHALAALRNINNNPKLFNANKRPIVAFSIENRAVLKIKQKRMEKSKMNNKLCPESKKPEPQVERNSRQANMKKRNRSEDVPTFAGMEAHPGTTVKLPSKRKIGLQGAVHRSNVHYSKKELKRKKFVEQTRKEKKREPKVKSTKKKQNRRADEEKFTQLVAKYKQKIDPNVSLKWYETG